MFGLPGSKSKREHTFTWSTLGSFVRFGLQGLGFQGFVGRVWSPRFRVSGFLLAGLGSKVSVCREAASKWQWGVIFWCENAVFHDCCDLNFQEDLHKRMKPI